MPSTPGQGLLLDTPREQVQQYSLDAESELLIALASLAPWEARVRQAREILPSIDAQRLLDRVVKNRMVPQLARFVGEVEAQFSDEFRRELLTLYRAETVGNLRKTAALLEILDQFETAGIQVLVYKGPILAVSCYGGLEHRHFWDLDLLVRREDVARGKQVILELGYEPELDLSPAEEAQHLRRDCELNFDHSETGIHVELHWDVLDAGNRGRFNIDVVWDQPSFVEVAGRQVATFEPEVTLLTLCMHGGDKHNWKRLKWITDVAYFVATHPDLDWERVQDLARRCDREASLQEGLFLAAKLLGSPLPEFALEAVTTTPKLAGRAALCRARVFRGEDARLPGFEEWQDHMRALGVSLRSGWKNRMVYLRGISAPSFRERRSLMLPSCLSFLYYLYRPLFLFKKHGLRRLGQRLR